MREPPRYSLRWSATVTLLVINIVAFIVQEISYGVFPPASPNAIPPTDALFALSIDGLKHWHLWQIFTFQFMHSGVLHLLLNCWALFVFGREVEQVIGVRRFMTLYFLSGVMGGLFQELVAYFAQNYFGSAVVGASAGILGVVAAFAMIFPERQLTLLLLFVIPVKLRAKYLLLISLALAALGMTFPKSIFGGNVAHAAHMGGILGGLFFIQYAMHWNFSWPWKRRTAQRPKRELVNVASGKFSPWNSAKNPPEEFSTTDFISREVDPILEKISAHGIHSLTERERKILDDARKKMTRS
jgi:membrane associated rhomboid family serine protease